MPKRAAAGDVDLEYEVSGTGDPVVFIHGAFIAESFRPLLDQDALADYQLITYRRRGYAGSSRTAGPMSGQAQAADCRALLQYLGLRRAHIVGHSIDGCIALQLALDAPELVHSLVLLEPALMVGASAQAHRESLLQSAPRYLTKGPQVVMEEFFRARWPSYTPAAPETFLSGYPFWVMLGGGGRFGDPEYARAYHTYLDAAVELNGPEMRQITEAAHDFNVFVFLGNSERGCGAGRGTVYCTLVAIDPQQGIVGAHRKLNPTHTERLVWGPRMETDCVPTASGPCELAA